LYITIIHIYLIQIYLINNIMIELINLKKMSYMHSLIKRGMTGDPNEFAKKLDLSRSMMYEYKTYIEAEWDAKISYSKSKNSYYYEKEPDFTDLI
ncbi:MAG: hypothetical protein LUH10_12235, partial [Tannerellaceae bacterium]|nr:hypothetical protein [Tannerellaceae bacterium]